MKVPFADISRDERETLIDGESVESRIKRNIWEVIEKKNFVLGDYVEKFEKNFAEYCGTKHCISVANGLSALELVLIGAGVKPYDEVITVANTFNATVGAIAKLGAVPVLVDANESDYNINPQLVAEAVTSKTKIILPVHLYGQTIEMNRLKGIADNIPIIEDACQAHGAKFNEQRAGNLGLAGCFSFYPGKNLGGYGDGGAITTNNDELANFLRKTRNYGQTKKYCHDIRPDNSRLDTIQAAVLIEKLKVLDEWNSMRANNAEQYRQQLNNVVEIKLPTERKKGEHVYHLFVIQARDRDGLGKFLENKQIQTGLHYPIPIHKQKCFEKLNYQTGCFPISEKLAGEIITLPMFPTMRKEEIKYTADSIKEFYSRKAS